MATTVRSDIYCCLRAQTIGQTKKSKKPKTPARTIPKLLRMTKNKTKKHKDLSKV